ncbi:hypothetical protein DM872_11510 [Pseudomonas taiwanensis]|uniref:hypothetical protein n=1 Tax=Pseudomonas taiwanensis TaxID=470150 RepID=UPI0015B97218|nr:hypothetical protein [Pseudomonas taiwanensis]NWL77479.1 hypothetical protein [Pseudomonas taiwanensis]
MAQGLADAEEIKRDGSTMTGILFDHDSRQEEMERQRAQLQSNYTAQKATHDKNTAGTRTEVRETQENIDDNHVIFNNINDIKDKAQLLSAENNKNDKGEHK